MRDVEINALALVADGDENRVTRGSRRLLDRRKSEKPVAILAHTRTHSAATVAAANCQHADDDKQENSNKRQIGRDGDRLP